jgi:leader peptidase (prepilin peptidase)/N-methyltransferase
MSIYADKTILIYCCFVALVLGCAMGSFLNCAAWRIAHGESFIKGRSHCTTCGHVLGASELIPVLSWVIQRGRCKVCKQKISLRYPLTELFFGLLTLLCLLRFDLTLLCLRNWILICCLFCLSLVDMEKYIIPDGILIFAAAVWLVFAPFVYDGWMDAGKGLLAAIIYGGGILLVSLALDKILKKDSLGGGDIKLIAVIGLYLGLVAPLFMMILACVTGLLFLVIRNKFVKNSPEQMPFGPFISAAAAVMLLYGDLFLSWYMGFFKL